MLCHACLRCLNSIKPTRRYSRSGFHPHHESDESFMAAVGRSCQFCNSVYKEAVAQNLGNYAWQRARGRTPRTEIQIGGKSGLELLQVMIRDEASKGFNSFILEKYDDEQTRQRQEIEQAQKNSCPFQLRLAKSWLDECAQQHDCYLPGWVPTRLIALSGAAGQSNHYMWRVVETSSQCDFVKSYGTVSHRWIEDTFKLTAQTYSHALSWQPDCILATALQRALEAARYLGIEFLWIDALCILQDSEDDWRRESLLMNKVYQQSQCNFATTASIYTPDHQPRNFSSQRLQVPELFQLDWRQSLSKRATMFYKFRTLTNHRYYIADEELWDKHMRQAGLVERGWIFQEFMLSPRTLHLFEDQISWECRARVASEWFPVHIPTTTRTLNHMLLENFKEAQTVHGVTKSWFSSSGNIWRNLITEYSLTKLTYSTDKLLAFAGVAKAFQGIFGGSYDAGMFHQFLPHDLCWRSKRKVASEQILVEPKVSRRDPSWSWASIDEPIEFGKDLLYREEFCRPCAIVRSIESHTVNGDPFGQAIYGKIELRGWLALLLFKSMGHDLGSKGNNSIPRMLLNDDKLIHFDVAEDKVEQDYFILSVLRLEFGSIRPDAFCGLVLTSAHDGEPTHFVRKGILWLNPKHEIEVIGSENGATSLFPLSCIFDEEQPTDIVLL